MPTPITASQLRGNLNPHAPLVVIHRHAGFEPHLQGEHSHSCWCSPLVLTPQQAGNMPLRDLQMLLDEHYTVS